MMLNPINITYFEYKDYYFNCINKSKQLNSLTNDTLELIFNEFKENYQIHITDYYFYHDEHIFKNDRTYLSNSINNFGMLFYNYVIHKSLIKN